MFLYSRETRADVGSLRGEWHHRVNSRKSLRHVLEISSHDAVQEKMIHILQIIKYQFVSAKPLFMRLSCMRQALCSTTQLKHITFAVTSVSPLLKRLSCVRQALCSMILHIFHLYLTDGYKKISQITTFSIASPFNMSSICVYRLIYSNLFPILDNSS